MRIAVGLLLALVFASRADCQQRTFVDQLDSTETKWSMQFLPSRKRPATRVVQHRREKSDWNQSGRAEVFRLSTSGRNQQAVVAYPLPPARPFDELKLRVRVKSSQAGHRLAARIVFVDHQHPETGRPLTAMIRGDSYSAVGEWQELTCVLDGDATSRALLELRVRTNLPLTAPGHTYVDTASIICDFNPGGAELAIDNVDFGPIIKPQRVIDMAAAEVGPSPSKARSAADMRLGQLRVNGKLFFPRIVPYHDETNDDLHWAGVNTVLIPDGTDTALIDRLRSGNFHVIAVPPTPSAPSTTQLVTDSSATITDDGRILLWYLGTSISPDEQGALVNWAHWLKSSDPLRRPIMADVSGGERVFSRYVSMLGTSRAISGTSVSLRDYRNSLLQRRSLAQPGKFMWTWTHTFTETDAGAVPVEPEQLRLQTFAALASGSKAIGYWSSTGLATGSPRAEEHRLAVRQLNLELGLIEDWLAAANLTGSVRCEANAVRQSRRRTTSIKLEHEAEKQRKSRARALISMATPSQTATPTDVEAAVFSTPYGQLLLPVWYSDSAQFVPEEMVADNLSLVVHAPQAERSAWMVTTTSLRSLETVKQEGGLRIRLSTMDKRAILDHAGIVVVTSRDDVLAALRSRIAAIAATAAQTTIELARHKLDRVQMTENRLAVPDASTAGLLNRSQQALTAAEQSLQQSDNDTARILAQRAMQYLRRLQHTRWKAMTQNLSSPVASPYATSYSGLASHNALARHLQSTAPTRRMSLMPEVTGTDTTLLKDTGWSRFPDASETIRARAQFGQGREHYFLMLSAAAANPRETPEIIARPPIRVTSPMVTVRKGEIVRVSGRVRVPSTIAANVDGAMLFDNLTGPGGALRWGRKTRGWVPFQLVRTARADGGFYVTILLSGLGSVQVSDLNVDVFPEMPADGF